DAGVDLIEDARAADVAAEGDVEGIGVDGAVVGGDADGAGGAVEAGVGAKRAAVESEGTRAERRVGGDSNAARFDGHRSERVAGVGELEHAEPALGDVAAADNAAEGDGIGCGDGYAAGGV